MKPYNYNGYVRIPRSIEALPPAMRTLLDYICHEVRHSSAVDTDFGTVDVGEMITSRSALMKATGLTAQKIRTAIDKLREGGYIEVEATAKYTKITLIWADFVSLRENNIMLNNQVDNQVDNQVTISASVEDSASYGGQKNEITKSVTKSVTNISNNVDKVYIHTQSINNNLVETKSAPARESAPASAYANDARVAELYDWMAEWTPELLAMRRTFQPAEVKEMVDSYPADTLHSILGQMWSKGVYNSEGWAKVVFDKYANKAVEVKAGEREELLTYKEMEKEVTSYGLKQEEHFEIVPQPTGKPKWRRIN